MNKLRATIVFSLLMAIGFASLFLSSCSEKSMDGTIIFTRSSERSKNLNQDPADSWKYVPQTQIVALNPENPEKSLKVLTKEYYSARAPQISFDGKFMLFAAQLKNSDPWQIWEINLGDLKTRQITSSKENCTDPAYLPGGRIVFSIYTPKDSLKSGHSLFTCSIDGSNLKRITFNPHTYLASSVLNDGRILTIDKQIFPEEKDQIYTVLRPDGTKAEIFYRGVRGSILSTSGFETSNESIVFIESANANSGKCDLISIDYYRPLHSRLNLTSEIGGDFRAVRPMHSGKLLVSYRKSETDRYALYEFDPQNKTLGKALYNNQEYDALEAVEAGHHDIPKKLPSEVDMGVKTGLLMCQDINILNSPSAGVTSSQKSSGIRIIGIDSTLGTVQVEEDGSFYLKVMADKPFKIQTIDKEGHVLAEPCGWIWIRPNERRGCVGCHEDPEMVPDNRVPLAVKRSPVTIPMHINKVVEKKVSLE